MIRYIIVDDEPIAHRIIEGYIKNLPQFEKIGNCYNAFEVLELLQKKPVDLLFLDINMPELSGFELLKTLSHFPKTIVTSAHKEFALEGYEFDVVDYLLKPFSLERFLKAINKIQKPGKTVLKDTPEDQYLFVKGDKKQHQVAVKTILFIEAYGNYCKVVLENETIVTLQKISEFEKLLPSNFIRIHKSYIVSKNKIKVIEGNNIHIQQYTIPVGQTYKSIIKSLFS